MCVCVLSPRVLMEEYGTGRYAKKHSTFYKVMMEELGLHTSEFKLHCNMLYMLYILHNYIVICWPGLCTAVMLPLNCLHHLRVSPDAELHAAACGSHSTALRQSAVLSTSLWAGPGPKVCVQAPTAVGWFAHSPLQRRSFTWTCCPGSGWPPATRTS
jgi:hypothetical protein